MIVILDNFLQFFHKNIVGTHKKCLSEALLMCTHSVFLWRIKKSYPRIIIQ